jgi:hypothetical protein
VAVGDPDAAGEPEGGGEVGGNGMYVQPGSALAAQATRMVAAAAAAMTLAARAKKVGEAVFMGPILAEIGA